MPIENMDQARAAAARIRSPETSEEEKDALMQEIRAWRDTSVKRPTSDEDADEKGIFYTGMAENVEKRQAALTDIFEATANGEQSYVEGALQVVGKYGAGLVADFLAETVMTGGRAVSFITPDAIKDPIKAGASAVGHAFVETEIGQAGIEKALQGAQAYGEWASENPRAARNLEATVNIAALAAPVKGAKPTTLAKGDSKLGNALRISADNREIRLRDNFVADLVSPKSTPSQRLLDVPRTEVKKFGPISWNKVTPTQAEQSAANAVWGIPGVSPKKSLVENRHVIWQEVTREAAALEKALKAKDKVVPLSAVTNMLEGTKAGLPKVVVGDAKNAANSIIDSGIEKLSPIKIGGKDHVLLSDVFRMRKEIDMDFRRAGRDPAKYAELGTAENGQYVALTQLRKATNQFVHQNARVEVQGSLAKQAALYKALDNVTVKAADEATSTLGQIWQRAMKVLPIRGEANQMAAIAFGTGGLGAGAIISAAFRNTLLAGVGGYGLYRALASPAFRRGLAVMVDGLSPKNLAKGTYNGTVLSAAQMHRLRMDRAYLMDLLKMAPESFEEPVDPAVLNNISNDMDREKIANANVESGQ